MPTATPDEKPFEWPRRSGCLVAWIARDYASWLFPKLEAEWMSPGVQRRDAARDNGKTKPKPYEFRKSFGWLNIKKDLAPFAVFVLSRLRKWSDRYPYQPSKKDGEAMVPDLIEFHEHVLFLLRKKREEQSRQKP